MGTTAESLDKERKAIELRRAGYTYEDIANAIGYADHTGARDACLRAIKRSMSDAGVDELRQGELDRLDRLQRSAWTSALQGDLQAIATCLRIIDRRSKLLGLDAPIKQEILLEQVDGGMIDREVARLVEMLNEQGNADSSIQSSLA